MADVDPDPNNSPSASVGGMPMGGVQPAPLSPSQEGQEPAPPARASAIDGIFDDEDDEGGDAGAAGSGSLPSVPRRQGGREQEEEEDEDEDDEDEEAERRRRRRRRDAQDDQDGEASQRRKKAKKSRDQGGGMAAEDEGDDDVDNGLPQMTEAERRRADVDARIAAAIKAGKKKPKRRLKDGEEDLDHQADAEVADLRSAMMMAAEDDVMSNEDRKPALAKLRLLPRVVDGLQKSHWQQSIFDSNLLEAVRRFLEPLPDKSLPALNIQRELFKALEKLSPSIDTISLKMSGLGKVVIFYSRCRRVEPDLRRRADRLIEAWSRPILKRSASYRAMEIPKAAASYGARRGAAAAAAGAGLTQEQRLMLSQGQSQTDPNRRNVSIPQPITGGFKVAPRSVLEGAAGAGGDVADSSARAANASRDRLNAFKRKVKEAKR